MMIVLFKTLFFFIFVHFLNMVFLFESINTLFGIVRTTLVIKNVKMEKGNGEQSDENENNSMEDYKV